MEKQATISHTYKASEGRWVAEEGVGAPQKMEAEGRGYSQQEGKKDRQAPLPSRWHYGIGDINV